jgi:hypothetical protein
VVGAVDVDREGGRSDVRERERVGKRGKREEREESSPLLPSSCALHERTWMTPLCRDARIHGLWMR